MSVECRESSEVEPFHPRHVPLRTAGGVSGTDVWLSMAHVLPATDVPSGATFAQYPAKPIRMVVGFPPGGGTDIVARLIQPRPTEYVGQSVVIENRPGATGTVAAGFVAKSPPDGYTIMMGHVSVNAIAPSLFSKLPYDVIKISRR